MCSFRSRHAFYSAVLAAALAAALAACVPIPGPSRATVTYSEGETDWQASFEQLLEAGARFATLAGVFELAAPVKGRAPVVVDFELDGDGWLRLEVAVEDAAHDLNLEFQALAGTRETAVRFLPPDLGGWQAAVLTVSAVDDSGDQPIGCQLFGIGVGERAVGSTAIYQVTFYPESIQKKQAAVWGFRSRQDFERAQIEIYRREPENGGESLVRALGSPCPPRSGQRCEGDWDGKDSRGKRSRGAHRISVKAWQQTGLEKDWILARSRELVEVR